MKNLCLCALFATLFAMGSGCNKESADLTVTPIGPGPSAGGTLPGEPTQAQAKLQTIKLWIGSEEMMAELALTPVQQQTGMMYRTNMAENSGMLFPLPYTQRASFWMKHCPLPLSAAYIDPEGIIQEIHDLQPHNTNGVVAGSENIRYVLETPQGWFQRHNIREGVAIRTEQGSLQQTFFRGQ